MRHSRSNAHSRVVSSPHTLHYSPSKLHTRATMSPLLLHYTPSNAHTRVQSSSHTLRFPAARWPTGQEPCASIRRQLLYRSTGPKGIKVFLDVFDLADTSRLEDYIGASSCVLIFLSRGYFASKACLTEAKAALSMKKPLIIVHDSDPNVGGVSFDQVQRECPDELKAAIFNKQTPVIPWLRLPAFQDEVLVSIAEATLHACKEQATREQLSAAMPKHHTMEYGGTGCTAQPPSLGRMCSGHGGMSSVNASAPSLSLLKSTVSEGGASSGGGSRISLRGLVKASMEAEGKGEDTPRARRTENARTRAVLRRQQTQQLDQLFMPNSSAATEYLVGPMAIYVSPHNPGAREVLTRLLDFLKAGSQASLVQEQPASLSVALAQQKLQQVDLGRAGRCGSFLHKVACEPSGVKRASSSKISVSDGIDSLRRRRSSALGARTFGHDMHAAATLSGYRLLCGKIRKAFGSLPFLGLETSCMALYLDRDVFCNENGEVNEPLCEELRAALDSGTNIILLHPIESVPFDHIIDTCPRDLIRAGLLRIVAIQLRTAYEAVSAALLAQNMQGKPFPRRERKASRKLRVRGAAIGDESPQPLELELKSVETPSQGERNSGAEDGCSSVRFHVGVQRA